MNLLAPQHLIPILIIILLLFGRGKISEFMGDFAKGIKSFKKGLKEDDEENAEEQASVRTIEAKAEEPIVKTAPKKAKTVNRTSSAGSGKTKS